MKEVVLVVGLMFLANLLAFVLSGGPKQSWEKVRDKHNARMNTIVSSQDAYMRMP
jgi:hypothetical protein